MRAESEVNQAVERYADTVQRICMVHLKNHADAEDIFQKVFLQYLTTPTAFASPEHEKAWIIRVTLNACKDHWKSFFRKNVVSLEEAADLTTTLDDSQRSVLQAVLSLPEKYRDVVYLHYYEGYSLVEIGELLGKKVNTIYTWMARAKDALREKLGGDWDA